MLPVDSLLFVCQGLVGCCVVEWPRNDTDSIAHWRLTLSSSRLATLSCNSCNTRNRFYSIMDQFVRESQNLHSIIRQKSRSEKKNSLFLLSLYHRKSHFCQREKMKYSRRIEAVTNEMFEKKYFGFRILVLFQSNGIFYSEWTQSEMFW